ncbi:LysR family transcriptional regulator [Myxococcus xanthus]|uniref:LysR family transcriptional regulator n=1 Tax=Myxococcus xanthus TaxID=34 RepID=A0A7Y4IJE9_MYXXA|nr:LysR family transcriptional regulator [Myxococcus xanthus]NOJ80393.1 LysR family transcriptional regulator [Myxococcus xanthus]NOJ84926.1 LysR family transcriptional regulator [Myxococcus xanthus]
MEPSLLPSLAWFAHVASHRSFTKAAAKMGVSRAALSQNLKALEKQLGVRLLNRTTRDMSLTEDGQHLFDALQPSLGAIESAVRSLGEAAGEASGLLKVNTARLAAKALVDPYFGEFLARYPKLSLELVMDDGLSNITASGCDVGIRLGQHLAEHMVAVPITPMLSMAVVGTPAYFARRSPPKTPADLVHHNCLNFRHTGSGALYKWEFTSPDGHDFSMETKGNLITNDDDSMLRAALQGVGLIQHIDIVVRKHLDDGSLVRVLKPWCPPFPGFYLYIPSRKQMPKKTQALIDFLVEKRKQWERRT